MFVKPVEGRAVRDPFTHAPVPPGGRHVEASAYWLRRLRDGDVEQAEPPAPDAPPDKE